MPVADVLIRIGPSAYEVGDVVSIHSLPLASYGTKVDFNSDFRIVRISNANLTALQAVLERDVLTQQQQGQGFDPRRRKRFVDTTTIPATGNMVDAVLNMGQFTSIIVVKPPDPR